MLTRPSRHPCRGLASGFTLIELLSVIAIIGVLSAIIIVSVGKARASAQNASCLSNLRQLSTAMRLYAQDNRQKLPVSASGPENWIFELSGFYIPRKASYIGYSPNSLITAGSGKKSLFLCEANIAHGATAPAGAASTYGMNQNLSRFNLTAVQNPARLVLLGDMTLYNGNWELRMQPNSVNRAPGKVHGSNYHFAFVDGHVAAQASYPTSATDAFWTP